jgi:uncharacterized membrane protein
MGAEALKAPSEYGGTVLKTSLSEDAERELQEAIQGTPLVRLLPPTSNPRAGA